MPKYQMSWWEKRQTIVEATSVEEAFEILNENEEGEFVKSEDYDCQEIKDEPASIPPDNTKTHRYWEGGKMAKYEIEFEEVNLRTVTIEADTEEEARKEIENATDIVDTYFHIDAVKRVVVECNKLD